MKRKHSLLIQCLVLCVASNVWLALLNVPSLLAQESTPLTQTVTADEVNVVASQLWCPLCSGVRLDTCELQACEQMREEIALKLQAGEEFETIRQYFFERYGPQVLGEPPLEGINWVIWLLPFSALAVAGVLLFWRGWQIVAVNRRRISGSGIGTPPKEAQQKDQYEAALDTELAHYD